MRAGADRGCFNMKKCTFPSLLWGLGMIALSACSTPATAVAGSTTALGVDLGPSSRVPSARAAIDASQTAPWTDRRTATDGVRLVHDGQADAHSVGMVNAVDPAQHKINLTHEPIAALGWPSMTMEFPVATSVDLKGIKPGARVSFTIDKGKSGFYEVQSVQPAGQGR